MFPSYVTHRRGHARFTVAQLNTLGRFDEPLNEVINRQKTLHSYLVRARPSIVALQEVPPSNSASGLAGEAHNIVDSLVRDERSAYQSICYAKQTERGDLGCLLFDSNVFELISEECFRFAGGGSQFAIVAVLRLRVHEEARGVQGNANRGTDRCVLVVAQHAKAGRTLENEWIRIDHSRQLISFLLNPQDKEMPPTGCSRSLYADLIHDGKFIWLGDMNAGPHSYESSGNNWPCEWYSRVIKGVPSAIKDENRGASALEKWVNTEVPLMSAMTIAHGGEEPPFTTYKMRDGKMIAQTIDYILISKGSRSLILCGVTSPATVFTARPLPPDGFPNEEWGSDHLPLLCEIEYRQAPPVEDASLARCWRD